VPIERSGVPVVSSDGSGVQELPCSTNIHNLGGELLFLNSSF
jgi:hypothetical protein